MWLFPLQLVGIHVGVEGLQIHGRGEEIALSVLAVRGKELLQLVFGLHALAEDLDAEAAGHVHERGNDDPDRALLFLPGGQEGDARRDNSPGSGAISSSKSLLHICQQNYKKAKGEGNPSPFLFTVYSVSFSRSASTAVSLPRLIS